MKAVSAFFCPRPIYPPLFHHGIDDFLFNATGTGQVGNCTVKAPVPWRQHQLAARFLLHGWNVMLCLLIGTAVQDHLCRALEVACPHVLLHKVHNVAFRTLFRETDIPPPVLE